MPFNRLIRDLLPHVIKDPININNDNLHHKALEAYQRKNDKGKDTQKDHPIFITGATVVVQ